MAQKKYGNREIRCRRVPVSFKNKLTVIAKNMGITLAAFVRLKLTEAIEQAPENLKTVKNIQD